MTRLAMRAKKLRCCSTQQDTSKTSDCGGDVLDKEMEHLVVDACRWEKGRLFDGGGLSSEDHCIR